MTLTESTAILAPAPITPAPVASAPVNLSPAEVPAPTAAPARTVESTSREALTPAVPVRFKYSIQRYHAAIAAGVLTENDRVELNFGELIEKLSIGERHDDCIQKLNLYFTMKYGREYGYRPQCSVTIPSCGSEPEPDYAIINKESYATRVGNPEPADVVLVIEVADASLEVDRDIKAPMCALASIAEYWIINLRHDKVEVCTQPDAANGVYNSIQRYGKELTFESPFCGEVIVAELLFA